MQAAAWAAEQRAKDTEMCGGTNPDTKMSCHKQHEVVVIDDKGGDEASSGRAIGGRRAAVGGGGGALIQGAAPTARKVAIKPEVKTESTADVRLIGG